MAIYLVTGKLGSGKSLACVGRIRDALEQGRKVATNLDLNLEHMLSDQAKSVQCMRIPDKPTVTDLEALGQGCDTVDESRHGLIVLDELGSWLNARSWADKSRQAVIDWLIHSRKKGWDVYFIAQSPNQVDKQVREALCEYLVICRRMDRMRIPFFGSLLRFVSGGLISGHLPRVHLAMVRYGSSQDAVIADRWVYLGTELYGAYDTRQVFRETYPHGPYSYLPPWHLVGWRHQVPAWRLALRKVLPGLERRLPALIDDRARGNPRQPLRTLPEAHARALRLAAKLPPEQAWRHARRICAALPS